MKANGWSKEASRRGGEVLHRKATSAAEHTIALVGKKEHERLAEINLPTVK
jgi:hypothetical protein